MLKTKSIISRYHLSLLVVLVAFLCSVGNIMAQLNQDSLLFIIKKTSPSDSMYPKQISALVNEYKLEGNIDKGIQLLRSEIEKIKVTDFENQIQLSENRAYMKGNLGVLLLRQGKYPEAQKNFIEAFNVYEKTNNQREKASTLSHIANLYRLQKQSRKALQVNFQVLDYKNHMRKNDLGSVYNNIALIYDFDLEKSDSALYYYNKALTIYQYIRNKRGISTVSGNISGVFTLQKKFSEAIKYRKEALSIDVETNDVEGQIYSYWGLGQIYESMNKPDSAENNYLIALAISEKLNLKREIFDAHSVLSAFYANVKQYDKAFAYQTEAQKISEQIYNEDMATSLNKMQTEFETQKKEQEIELLQKDQTIKQSNIDKQKQIILWGIVIFILILGLLFLFIRSNIERKKINRLLSNQKNELEKLSIVASETNNAVVIADAVGDIIWVNKGFEKLYHTTLADIKQSGEINVKKLSSNPHITELFDNAVKEHHPVNYIGQVFNDASRKQWIQTTLTPIYKNGEIDKIVFIDSDITLLKDAEEEITMQKNQLEIKNTHITQSINYAQRLQQAILPTDQLLSELFSDYFVFFKPKDIVSGDFYWAKKLDDKVLFSVIDCTGHGVPGAFMTIFAHNLLEMITTQLNITNPAEILNHLSIKLHDSFSKGNETISDGMELMMCSYDAKTQELIVSGAFSSLYHLSASELHEIKGDLISIGNSAEGEVFTNQKIQLVSGDLIYLFTDGYPDQKGGEKGKKFMYKPFRELLIKNHTLPLIEQHQELEMAMNNWKVNHQQMDDMCILGVKF